MSANKLVWVTGSTGFLGSVILEGLKQSGYDVVGTGTELSICEPERLESFADEVRPDIIVNCAGIRREATTLDNKARAYEVNALGAKNIAIVANAVDALIVQISTDDVYSSGQGELVNEFDMPNPSTPYGKSKRAGEFMVRDVAPEHLILRASWVYKADRGHFKNLMDAARSGGRYEARTDQFAAPASIALYMHYILKMLEADARGTYHIAPTGKTSRYDFAAQILENAGYDSQSVLVPTTDPSTAEDIVLESLMLEMAGAKVPTWQEDLRLYMEREGLLTL